MEAGGRGRGGGVSSVQAEDPKLWSRLAGARAERTINIWYMFVTLDVSKLSGWLNADKDCRVERESIKQGATGGHGGRRAWGRGRRKQRAGRGPKCGGCRQRPPQGRVQEEDPKLWRRLAGARAERTRNM